MYRLLYIAINTNYLSKFGLNSVLEFFKYMPLLCQCAFTDFSKEPAAVFFSLVYPEERCNNLLHNNGNYVPIYVTS